MFKLTSPAFKSGETIPKLYTCEGKDPSPELNWTGAPAGTKSFALIMDDPDAPVGLWVHWVLYDIPGNLPRTERVLDGAKHGASWGVDSFSRVGYGGPCPPPGKPHRYFFKPTRSTRCWACRRARRRPTARAMEGHVLGRAELMVCSSASPRVDAIGQAPVAAPAAFF